MTMTKCVVCTKAIVRKRDKRRSFKYCSFECYLKNRKLNPLAKSNCKCENCGKEFHLKPSAIGDRGQGKYCSFKCKIEVQRQGIEIRGESYNDRHLIRQSSQYRTFRTKAKQLNGNKCQKCGVKDKSECECCGNIIYLHVNHIKPFATYLESRFDPTNANVLCSKCHKDYGK